LTCVLILYINKFELNRCSLSKVIERTPNFDNGRTHGRTGGRTGVTLNAPPPFFEWRGHKNDFLKKCGPQIWHCLFMFWPITLKQLNSLTSIDTFTCLFGCKVTHPTAVHQVPGLISGPFKDLYVCLFVLLLFPFLYFVFKTLYLSCNFAISFAVLINLVFSTYCSMCDRFYGYQGTDLPPLTHRTAVQQVPGSNPGSDKDFYVSFFDLLLLLCFCVFCVSKTVPVMKLCSSHCNFILFSILNILQIL